MMSTARTKDVEKSSSLIVYGVSFPKTDTLLSRRRRDIEFLKNLKLECLVEAISTTVACTNEDSRVHC